MKIARSLSSGVLVLCVCWSTAAASGGDGKVPASPGPNDAAVMLDNAADELRDALSAADNWLTAVISDHVHQQIVITTSSATDPFIAPLVKGLTVPVVVEVVPHSFAYLREAMSSASGQMDGLDRQGIHVRTVGIDMRRGVLDVELDTFSEQAVATAREAFGNDIWITDTSGTGEDQAALGRNFDSQPWWGGDFVSDDLGQGRDCSTSFTAHNSSTGTDNIFTAGHCLFDNHDVFNNTEGWGGAPIGGDLLMGHVYYSFFGNASHNNLDYAIIRRASGTTANHVYRDWSGGYVDVTAEATAGPGSVICVDGAYTGQVCGFISEGNYFACSTYGGQRSCDLLEFYDPDGHVIFGHGDSGAPAYRSLEGSSTPNTNGQNVRAEGIGVALRSCCDGLPCEHYASGGRTCTTVGWMVDINSVEADSNNNVRTS